MRIVDPEVIQREEKALIESIKSLFLFDVFHQECKDKYNIDLARLEELNSGDIVIEQDNVLFKLNALCKVGFAILIDREGNYMAFDFSTEPTEVADDANEKQTILSVPDTIRKKEEEIVRAISKEINTNNIEAVFENEFKAKLAGDIQSEGGKLTIYKSTFIDKYMLIAYNYMHNAYRSYLK